MRDVWFENRGVRLFAAEDGDGPAIVMLHGGMATHEAALPVVAGLASRYRVITPDVRGNGRSVFGESITFDQLADDVIALIDALGVARAIVGGVSGGSGVALRCALQHGDRLRGLLLLQPVYAGAARGYTAAQQTTFTMMDHVASRAVAEGVQVLRPLYAQLPEPVRTRALAMIERFDAASVVATSRFIASGVQPFEHERDLESISVPTLLVCGNDPLHPPEVSELYARSIPTCTMVPAGGIDVADRIGVFCDGLPA